jgi:ABC-type methionine transport system permease subunit
MAESVIAGLIAALAVFLVFRREEGLWAGILAGGLGGFVFTVGFWRLAPEAAALYLAVVALLIALASSQRVHP